jgi:hypothetical protein
LKVGDFLRVARPHQLAKSPRGIHGHLGRCASSCTQMAKVELPETVWKFLHTGQPPHHKPRHRREDERFPCGAQPLVVLGPLLRLWLIQAKVRSTTHLRGRRRKPRGGISLCQSTSSPSLAHYSLEPTALYHLLGERLVGLAHHLLHAQPQSLLCAQRLLLPWYPASTHNR